MLALSVGGFQDAIRNMGLEDVKEFEIDLHTDDT